MKTCKHFRFLIPKEYADELREFDSEPCEVCDPKYRSMGDWMLNNLIKISKQHFNEACTASDD
jgi:hypothetical protein